MNFTLKPTKLNKISQLPLHKLDNSTNKLENFHKTSLSKQKQTLRLFSKLKNKKQHKNQQPNTLKMTLRQSQSKNQLQNHQVDLSPNYQENSIQKQKMLTTKATNYNQSVHNQSSFMNVSQERALKDQIQHFKIIKAHEIADIAIKGQIQVEKVMKRLLPKLQKDLFDCIKTLFELDDSFIDSGAKKNAKRSSPKQLGSTIEHTFTPKTISTPGIQFNSNSGYGTEVNQFSIRQTQFTLGNTSSTKKKLKQKEEQQKQKLNKKNRHFQQKKVSQFNLGLPQKRLPLSKKIKDKIMNNSRRNQLK